MELKTVEVEGVIYAEVKDGKPVYVDGGKEIAADYPAAASKISALNHEAMEKRRALDEAAAKLKAFEGIDDPAAARKALDTIANLDDKKLVDAGEIERVKAAAIAAVEEQYKPFKTKAEELEAELRQEKIGGSFARSKFIAERLAMPADFIEARFGRQFEIENGKIIAKDANGNPLFSRERPGEPASFDEAIEILVSQHPQRDHLLKGSGASGSGSQGGEAAKGGAKVMPRAEYDKLDPMTQGARIREGYTLTD